ncbi:MAG: HAMP domain-containing histidine kinase [Phycisphaerales bacterium]|nr:HAMP domain-containing histidine kinase [Phycisphaerales bacterium]
MWYPKGIASRLALAVLAAFGLIQVVLCALVLIVREGEVRRDFDERLVLRASSAMDAVETAFLRTGQLSLAQRASPTSGLALTGVYWQLRRPDGAILEHSSNLGESTLPEPAAEPTREEAPALTTWRGPAVDALLGRGGAMRLLTVRNDIDGEEAFVLQVARDLEPVTTSIRSLRRVLLLTVALGLVLSGIAAWVLAQRVQRGIVSIMRQAQGITAGDPQRRIAHAGGEGELRQLAASLNSMLDGLEHAMRSREQFVADVSHELKAPLTALAAEARMMAAASRTSDICRQLDTAVQSVVGTLTGTADALLMLARCAEGPVATPAAQVSLNEVVTDAVAHCLAHARPRGVRLIPILPDALDPLLAGHADLLRVMLENLVRNAIDHSPEGGPVHVVFQTKDSRAEIAVTDTGPGVPEELISRVFDRFVTARPPAMHTYGHGLGLAIAKRVVDLHGGTIRLANRPAGGCEVVVVLPLEPPNGESGT